MWKFALLCLFCALFDHGFSECIEVTLQENIDYPKLAGEWYQYRHTPSIAFKHVKCIYMKIFDVDSDAKRFSMKSFFNPETANVKKGLPHTVFKAFRSSAQWGERKEGEAYIGDHIASDYKNYLIMYQCDEEGHAYLDIELKAGVTQLSVEKVEEIEDILSLVKIDYSDLELADTTECPFPF